MRTRHFSIVLVLGLVTALLLVTPTTANAGCKKLYPSGPIVCSDWFTGSAVCDLLLKGFKGPIAEDGEIVCGIYGTDPDEVECEPESYYPASAPDCDLLGRAACLNPQGKYNEQGTSFNLPGPIYENATTITCDTKGKCTTSATVDVEGNGGICNNLWELEFTPKEFYGQVCVCPGGFAGGKCCADGDRIGGECAKENEVYGVMGVADCQTSLCKWDADTYGDFYAVYTFDPDAEPFPYSCE